MTGGFRRNGECYHSLWVYKDDFYNYFCGLNRRKIMGIAFIKKMNEKMPYWVKQPFADVIRNQLICNHEFKDTYHLLVQSDSMSDEEKKEYQLHKLKAVLRHAYDHTVYYHQLFEEYGLNPGTFECVEDLQKLPILTKDILKSRLDDLMADDIDDFYMVTTGGSSGEPTKLQMEKNAIYCEWAFIYHYWSKFGYDFNSSKLATFRGVDTGTRICEINPLYSEIRLNPFMMNSKNIGLYNQKIDKYGADFIYGYPSSVYNYCRLTHIANLDMKGKYRAALLISENLYPFQEKLIREVLGCPIVMFYGHSERAVFAEKYNAGCIFNPMYGIIEIDSNTEPIVKGFINGKVPLVRYAVDDQVEYVDKEYYEIVGHHTAEVLIGSNGEQVSMAAVNFHDNTFDNTTGYQFVQSEIGKCIIRVTADSVLSDSKLKLISDRVQNKLGKDYSCDAKQVPELEKTPRGKYQMLIQKIASGG